MPTPSTPTCWGKREKERYRELVEEKWNKLPRLKQGQQKDTQYDADWLSGLMVQFAKEDGDLDR